MRVLLALLRFAALLAMTYAFMVLYEYGLRDYAAGAQRMAREILADCNLCRDSRP